MIVRATCTSIVVAVITVIASACGYYQASDRPICGDQVLPTGHTCALWPTPCGCAADQKCSLTSGGNFACAAPGPKGVDAPCADDTECARGTFCDGTRCRQTCFETLDCGTDPTLTCLDWSDDRNARVAGSCARDCDPVSPQAPSAEHMETCLANENCVIGSAGVAQCTRTGGQVALGAACTQDSDCVIGALCVRSVSKCAAWCWTDAPSCPTGTKCAPLYDGNNAALAVLGRALGACLK